MLEIRLAALATEDSETHLDEMSSTTREAILPPSRGNDLLTQARKAVVEDGLLTRDEENALNRYTNHFDMAKDQLK